MVSASTQQLPVRPPALLEAITKSTSTWQDDLYALFKHAKDRFPDVAWDLVDEEADDKEVEVWGHKAMVYARAPPSFQARYFSFRPAPIASPVPYSSSPTPSLPAQSALSLSLGIDYTSSLRSVSPSPFRSSSPAPSSITGTFLRLPLSHNPAFFANELEFLYTARGIGEAFHFLFDSSERREEDDSDEGRVDKLRKDLVYMWRSRLYSDVRIELESPSSTSPGGEETTAVFSAHRFLLISRSPYFYDQLITYGQPRSLSNEPITIKLHSPPFTPPSLHFTLGFIYTGTLNFSNRTYDLDTAFHIMRSATYLQLSSLYDEVQARLVQEMLHGLFHAFLEFPEYERITGGKWGTGGCRCRQCARRAPRALEFAVQPDVQNIYLERGARRALVGLFGEGWVTPEFATLPQKTKDGLLKGLAKRTVPVNVFALLFAAHAGMNKLNSVMDTWADSTREMVLGARKVIDDTLCNQADACFEQPDWLEIMEADGGRFEDGEKVEWVMESIRRGLAQKNAGRVYQTLVSSVLLRPHPTEEGETILSNVSHVYVQVEQTRKDILLWLRHRWASVLQEGGFENVDGWALKEISYEIDVPIEDLYAHSTSKPRASLGRQIDAETSSMHSVQSTVLTKASVRDANRHVSSSGASVRSVARSHVSTVSRNTVVSTAAPSFRSRLTVTERESRPDSKLAPALSSSASSSRHSMDVDDDASSLAETARSQATSSSKRPGVGPRITRPPLPTAPSMSARKSSAASVSSVRSKTSAVRSTAGGKPSTLRPPPASPAARPTSSASMSSRSEASTTSTTFKTARESVARTRPLSTASTRSTMSTRSAVTSPRPQMSPQAAAVRKRRPSDASSVASSVATSRTKRAASNADNPTLEKPMLMVKKTPSSTSMRSTRSTASTTSKRTTVKRPPSTPETSGKKLAPSRPLPKAPSKETVRTEEEPVENTSSVLTVKGKGASPRADLLRVDEQSVSSESTPPSSKASDSGTSSHSTIRKKESNDTIKNIGAPAPPAPSKPPVLRKDAISSTLPPAAGDRDTALSPRGVTLDIGIPCIISSKRKRFRAFARYIGEVEGEHGPWVGVEVPVSDEWMEDQSDRRQWNDGTWGGIRYFDVGSSSEWGEDERMTSSMLSRKRRVGMDWVNGQKGLKREGDSLSIDRKKRFRSASPSVSDVSTAEYRGLFVRPQQVLYVVDAVGSDI